jgi:hypothetical protein
MSERQGPPLRRKVQMPKPIAIALILLAFFTTAAPAQVRPKKVKEKRFEPVVKRDARAYAGRYIGIEPSYVLEIRVGPDGGLEATSYEGERLATLREIRLSGAEMTATKAYRDGAVVKFEGRFVNRVLNGESVFGVLVRGLHVEIPGATLDRVFYRHTAPIATHQ